MNQKEKLQVVRVGLPETDLKYIRQIAHYNGDSVSTTIRKILQRHSADIRAGANTLKTQQR